MREAGATSHSLGSSRALYNVVSEREMEGNIQREGERERERERRREREGEGEGEGEGENEEEWERERDRDRERERERQNQREGRGTWAKPAQPAMASAQPASSPMSGTATAIRRTIEFERKRIRRKFSLNRIESGTATAIRQTIELNRKRIPIRSY